MKKIVYLDMDDTITELLKPWVNWLNEKYNLNVKIKDIREWDMEKAFPSLTFEQVYAPLIMNNQEFWESIQPAEHAQYYIEKLQKDFDVYIVTATDYRNVFPKVEYVLHRLYPNIDDQHIIITYRKDLLKGFVIVDDYENYLKDSSCHKILINKPYNKKAKGDYIRVDNWEEIWYNINMLDELERSEFL